MTRAPCSVLATLTLLLMMTFPAAAATPSAETLVLGIHPYLPASELQMRFAPLANYLGRVLGQPVSVRIGTDYDAHIDAIGKDRIDVAFMGPAPYVKMLEKYGAKPLLARFEVNGKPNLYGVIFTRQDSALHRLQDIKDRRFAFGDPESTMSHFVPRYMLMEAGVPTSAMKTFKFLGSHKNVAQAVLAGDFDAGAVKQEVFDEFSGKGLRSLAVSAPSPDHLFVARSTLPAAQIRKLRQALLQLKDQPDGKTIMYKLHKGLTALIPASEKDYDSLRNIVHKVETMGH